MNKSILFAIFAAVFSFPLFCTAQNGILTTVAGTGSPGFSGDGGPATAAAMSAPYGVVSDGIGNLYFFDGSNHRIRKVNAAGIITTVAGGGASAADGIPATAASLTGSANRAMAVDRHGNLYFGYGWRIRKLTVATGILTTVAGAGYGFSGDGGPATAAQLNVNLEGVCFDAAGNMYIGDAQNERVRKVDAAGIITTIAGTGVTGFGGDGGPATAATLSSPGGVCADEMGNIFIADRLNNRIRKIDPYGIITTYAGSGVYGFSGDGGPATAAFLGDPYGLCMDSHGNLYIADAYNWRIRKVNAAGIISTFAGGGSLLGSGVPATAASFAPYNVCIDRCDNIYISDGNRYRVCEVGTPSVISDSFFVVLNKSCSGISFRIISNSWSSGQHVKTFFGNGTIADTLSSAIGTRGLADFYRSYNTGTYTIKHVLYNGTAAVDSVSYSCSFAQCQNFGIRFFDDANGDCIKDGTEAGLSVPVTVEIDSAGVAIDTIPAISGFYYTAYGTIGDTYQFKVLSHPPGTNFVCGPIGDTLSAGGANIKEVGGVCSAIPGFDLRVFPSFRAGPHHFGGTIIVNNTYCTPRTATLTMQLNPKYNTSLSFSPPPATIAGNTVTWNISALSSIIMAPVIIHADMETAYSAKPAYGDTVITSYAVNPVVGDANPIDNIVIRNDTVRGGYDPNDINVTPSGCVLANDALKYTIHFENTGNDTAFNIYVLDTLSASIDPRSINIMASSAIMYTSVIRDGGYNILKFDFPGINLLDSSRHGLCDGMVVFKASMRSGMASGTTISNRAGIYFDYNPVVMTNTIYNTTDCVIDGLSDVKRKGEVEIHPNPAANCIFINADEKVFSNFIITDCIGQTIMRQQLNTSTTKVDISVLPSGVYFITIQGTEGNIVRKMVKI